MTNTSCQVGPGSYCRDCELEASCAKTEKEPAEQKCRVCGCTWENACPGGCYWVEPDLCSQCAGAAEVGT
jgi:hypothetical protein